MIRSGDDRRYGGLIAATFTPMREDGSLDLAAVDPMTDAILDTGVRGLYVCGSTGEGFSLSSRERKEVAAAFVGAAAGRVPVMVQVGHDSLSEARELARHAAEVGADAVSATPPIYFRPADIATVVKCAGEVAAGAPELDFFYYHIPIKTGVQVDMMEFVERCISEIPTFAGVKFSDSNVHELCVCADRFGDRTTLLFGTDEMLLAGLLAGAHGAVGSTYNFLAAEALEVMEAFAAGDLRRAQAAQKLLTEVIVKIVALGKLPALKAAMNAAGIACGGPRLPLLPVSGEVMAELAGLIDGLRKEHQVSFSSALPGSGLP